MARTDQRMAEKPRWWNFLEVSLLERARNLPSVVPGNAVHREESHQRQFTANLPPGVPGQAAGRRGQPYPQEPARLWDQGQAADSPPAVSPQHPPLRRFAPCQFTLQKAQICFHGACKKGGLGAEEATW